MSSRSLASCTGLIYDNRGEREHSYTNFYLKTRGDILKNLGMFLKIVGEGMSDIVHLARFTYRSDYIAHVT